MHLFLSTTLSSREIKKCITTLLRTKLAKHIKKIQYVKGYSLGEDEKTIVKQEEKILMIFYDPEKKEKLMQTIQKIFPEKTRTTIEIAG